MSGHWASVYKRLGVLCMGGAWVGHGGLPGQGALTAGPARGRVRCHNSSMVQAQGTYGRT